MLSVAPLAEMHVTSPYGWRDVFGQEQFHEGIDYAAAVGTPVYASGDGVVQAAGDGVGGSGGGLAVAVVDDDDGQLFYLHLSRIDVRAGDSVRAGTQLGLTGETGRVSGPHLHVQWRPNWPARETADPGPLLSLLPSPLDVVGDSDEGGGGLAAVAGAAGLLLLLR